MSSTAYRKGYAEGFAAATNGKGKNYVGLGRGILTFNFENYSAQYTAGYDEGYRIGLRRG